MTPSLMKAPEPFSSVPDPNPDPPHPNPDPPQSNPLVRGMDPPPDPAPDPDPSIILLSSSKNSEKILDSYCFVTSFGFLSL
jgi:hypothetical protein